MNGPRQIRAWASFLRRLRRWFDERGFFEVQTDHVVPAGAFEGTLDTLKVSWPSGSGELHTSPEIEMKRLLATDRLPIYQITRCFRDDPETPIHRREFTMLEYYRVGSDWRRCVTDLRAVLDELAGRSLPFEQYTVTEILRRLTGIDLASVPTAAALRAEIEGRKLVALSPDDTWADMYFKLMIERVEPALPPSVPVLLTDYPASLSPLSKPDPTGTLAERFEIYWHGMELCNGCTELTDAVELRRRYEAESQSRRALGKAVHPLPARLIEALEKGLPDCAGVAIGLERLFRCLELTAPRATP